MLFKEFVPKERAHEPGKRGGGGWGSPNGHGPFSQGHLLHVFRKALRTSLPDLLPAAVVLLKAYTASDLSRPGSQRYQDIN